jgi:LPXTG-motif cell wall-anchored protein
LPEFFAFGFAFVIAATVIWQIVAFERLPSSVWLQNSAAILLLSAGGLFFRKRRQRLAQAEKTFYAGKITANG